MPSKRLSSQKGKAKACSTHKRQGGAPKESAAKCGYRVGACKRGKYGLWYKIIAAGKSKRWQKCSAEENRKLNLRDKQMRARSGKRQGSPKKKVKGEKTSLKKKKTKVSLKKKKLLKKKKVSAKKGKKASLKSRVKKATKKSKPLSPRHIAQRVKRALIRGGCGMGNGNLGGG